MNYFALFKSIHFFFLSVFLGGYTSLFIFLIKGYNIHPFSSHPYCSFWVIQIQPHPVKMTAVIDRATPLFTTTLAGIYIGFLAL